MANNINPSAPHENPIDMSDKYSDIKVNIANTFNRINNKLDIIILYNFPSGNTGGGSNNSGSNNGSNSGSNSRPKPKKPAQQQKPKKRYGIVSATRDLWRLTIYLTLKTMELFS